MLTKIKFDCNGPHAPAYSCSEPGDNFGEYVRTTDNLSDRIPAKLQGYLTEQAEEGAEITMTASDDANFWIIRPYGLPKWLVLVSCYDHDDDYQLVNVSAKAYDRLKKIINEAINE